MLSLACLCSVPPSNECFRLRAGLLACLRACHPQSSHARDALSCMLGCNPESNYAHDASERMPPETNDLPAADASGGLLACHPAIHGFRIACLPPPNPMMRMPPTHIEPVSGPRPQTLDLCICIHIHAYIHTYIHTGNPNPKPFSKALKPNFFWPGVAWY